MSDLSEIMNTGKLVNDGPAKIVNDGPAKIVNVRPDEAGNPTPEKIVNVRPSDLDFSDGDNGRSFGNAGVNAVLPELTVDEVADYLTEDFWTDFGTTPRKFAMVAGDTLDVDISALTAAGRYFARAALEAWTKVSGINFNEVTSGADITFDDNDSGAYAYSNTNGFGTITSSHVNVSTAWIAGDGTNLNSYSFQTYMHEIGHALGLGHAGNYNGTGGYQTDGSGDNHFLNDSWQMSVMSYFSQNENSFINASYAYVATPMIADIQAIQDLYGTAAIRTGNTTYGENSNAGGYYNNLLDEDVTFTIIDTGGIDTIDFHSSSAVQTVDLAAGAISDVNGLIGNLIIARDTIIENFFSGSGDDYIQGNDANNLIKGGEGEDEIYGGNGDDTLKGQQGHDTIEGGDGEDTIWGAPGSDTLDGNDDNDFISGGAGGDTITGGEGDDELRGNRGTDIISGGEGEDDIRGGGGKDTLNGGEDDDYIGGGGGTDTIIGGGGKDTLRGGAEADTFVFLETSDSTDDANADVIEDFAIGEDQIDLSGVTSGLSFIGDVAFTGTGSEIQATDNGLGDTIVRIDVDGDGTADMQIVLENMSGLTVDDFIL